MRYLRRRHRPDDAQDPALFRAGALVQQPEIAEELAARAAQPRPVVLEALQDGAVALPEMFLAQPLRIGRAGIVAAATMLIALREHRCRRQRNAECKCGSEQSNAACRHGRLRHSCDSTPPRYHTRDSATLSSRQDRSKSPELPSVELSDLSQEPVAGSAQPNLVLLEAAQNRHVAFAEMFAAHAP